MKQFKKIVMSDVEPDTNCIWLNNRALYVYKNGSWVPILKGSNKKEDKLPTYYIKGTVAEEYRDSNKWISILDNEMQLSQSLGKEPPTTEAELRALLDEWLQLIIDNADPSLSQEDINLVMEEINVMINQRKLASAAYYFTDKGCEFYDSYINEGLGYDEFIELILNNNDSIKEIKIDNEGNFTIPLDNRKYIIPLVFNPSSIIKITETNLPNVISLDDLFTIYNKNTSRNESPNLTYIKMDIPSSIKYALNLFKDSIHNATYIEINAPGLENATSMFSISVNDPHNTIPIFKLHMPNLKICDGMFSNLNIEDFIIDITNSKIESTQHMYSGTLLKEVDIKSSTIKKATSMFRGCNLLKSAYINFPNTTLINSMFSYCDLLTETYLDVPKCEDFNYTFERCTSLKSVSIKTQKLKNINSLFYNCPSLTFIDLSLIDNIDIGKTREYFYRAFYNVKNCIIKCKQQFKDFCLAHINDLKLDSSVTFEVVD